MKKIDWDNLEYYDFVGIVAGTALLIFCLYFGTLWYVTYDYRIETRVLFYTERIIFKKYDLFGKTNMFGGFIYKAKRG